MESPRAGHAEFDICDCTIEHHFRTLKHFLGTGVCQVQGEDTCYGHLVLRLVAGLVLLYVDWVLFKGQITMEEIIFSLKHH